MSDADVAARIADYLNLRLPSKDGRARQALWTCEDGWLVAYTTARIQGGPHHGEFTFMVYKPKGDEWVRIKWVARKTRQEAKHGALMAYYDHSPKAAKKHGWDGLDYKKPKKADPNDGPESLKELLRF